MMFTYQQVSAGFFCSRLHKFQQNWKIMEKAFVLVLSNKYVSLYPLFERITVRDLMQSPPRGGPGNFFEFSFSDLNAINNSIVDIKNDVLILKNSKKAEYCITLQNGTL